MSGVADLGEERFVSLTTYRRNGEGVATPVWVAASGQELVVTTGAASGKVKRLRRNAEVGLRVCNRRGVVADGAPSTVGRAVIVDDPADVAAATALVAGKYGVEYKILMLIERVVSRGSRDRVILRILDA